MANRERAISDRTVSCVNERRIHLSPPESVGNKGNFEIRGKRSVQSQTARLGFSWPTWMTNHPCVGDWTTTLQRMESQTGQI